MKTSCKLIIFMTLLSLWRTQTTYAQQKQALLVGISDYGNPKEEIGKWANLHGANDVRILTPLLRKQGFTVTSLVDSKATYSAILKELDCLARNCQYGDLIFLQFSMHGQPFEDLNGDENDGWDEALIPVDAKMKYQKGVYEGQKHLLDDTFGKYCDKIRTKIGTTGMLYVVIDACHCGTSSRGNDDYIRGVHDGFSPSKKEYKADRRRETNDYFRVSTKRGQSPVTFLEACRSYQRNIEIWDTISKTRYGSLSFYVAQALKRYKIDKTDKWIKAVKEGMETDTRLRKQNMVIETSK